MERESVEPKVDYLPGEHAKSWISYHQNVAPKSTYVYDFVWDITADAIGPFCTDVDGNVFMDFTSHVGAAPLGYNNPHIHELLTAFDFPDPLKIAGQDFYIGGGGTPNNPDIPGPMHLMDRLIDLTGHYDMEKVFLVNSGSEAVENAIKICYSFTGQTRAITFEGGFHGRTLGALSFNRSKSIHRRGFPELARIETSPYCENRSCSSETCSCGFFVDDRSILDLRLDPDFGSIPADEVAFIILEPIQGEGGYRIPSNEFMKSIARICDECQILLIADEIQSGLGRTGSLWGSDNYPIQPDVITAGKGLRVGATISREEIFPNQEGRISSTWGAGDIIASMQGVLTIDTILAEDLMDNAIIRGNQIVESIADSAPVETIDVRGQGLMIGIEFESKPFRDEVVDAAFEHGLLTLGCGYRTLRLLPPLDVTAREAELGVSLLMDAIDSVT